MWLTFSILVSLVAPVFAVDAQQLTPPTKSRPPAGTPLPPANPDIAKTWQPEVRQTVEGAIALFGAERRQAEDLPSIAEIGRVLGAELVPLTLAKGIPDVYAAAWRIRGLSVSPPWPIDTEFRFGDPRKGGPLLWKSFRYSSRPKAYSYVLDIPFETQKFCLDPYELAIYFGADFSGMDGGPHNTTHYPPKYEWEMFARAKSGLYFSNKGFHIYVDTNVVDGQLIDARCVKVLSISSQRFSEKGAK